MFNQNKIGTGVMVGLLLPLLSFGLMLLVFEGIDQISSNPGVGGLTQSRLRTLLLVAICLNVIPLRYYQRKRYDQSLRGLVFPTFALAIVWLVIFAKDVL